MVNESNFSSENEEVKEGATSESAQLNGEQISGASEQDAQAGASKDAVALLGEFKTLLEAIQSLSSRFDMLQQGFDSKIKYDSSKERIIDTLHKELQAYREDMHFKILRPIFLDLIAMHDDISSLMRHANEVTSESEALAWRNLASFQDTVEDILYRNGVEVYSEEAEVFVANRQRSIKRINTDRVEKDKLVAQRLRKGFEYEGKILRSELVATFRFIKN